MSTTFAGMPTYPYLYANDLIAVLKQKHASGTYKSMVNFSFLLYILLSVIEVLG